MKTYIKSALAIVSALVFAPQLGFAEHPSTQVKASIKLERLQGVLSPELNPGTTSRQFKPKQWMFLEAKLSLQAAPVPPTGYIDNLIVRFHVAAKNPEGKNSLMMSKEIKYVNIPVGQETYVCVFMSPSSIRRLTGTETIGSTTFTLYGVEVLYKDKIVAFDTNKGKPGWWAKPTPALVPTQSYPLLNKNETPFAMFWYDRYPEIAPLKDVLTDALAPLLPATEDDAKPAEGGNKPAATQGGTGQPRETSRRKRPENQPQPVTEGDESPAASSTETVPSE